MSAPTLVYSLFAAWLSSGTAHAQTEPGANTADGVANERNCRVEITWR